MKTLNLNFKLLLLLTFFGSVIISCDQNKLDLNSKTNEKALEEAITQTEIDNISEEINDIGEDIFFAFGNTFSSKTTNSKNDIGAERFPECLTISKNITYNGIHITLDYGNGCLNRNDNFLSGKIIVEVGFNFIEKSVTIDYSFDDFYFNSKKIEGSVQIMKLRKNENENPQATIIKDLKIIWEDGSFVSIKGERNREWIEGYGNDVWGDNVFSVTGMWTIIQKNGIVKTATIIEPLIRTTACRFIVSGIVEIQKNENIISIDYGNGDCDNVAIATFNGVEKEIQLDRKRDR